MGHRLQWANACSGPRRGLRARHTDARREWADARDSRAGRLSKAGDRARKRGWIVVDMAGNLLRLDPRPSHSR